MLQTNTTFLTLALVGVAWAAQGETLPEAIAEAQRNNAELRVLEESLAASKGGITTARTFPNPELTFAPGIRHTTEQGVAAKNDFHGDFALSQLFEWPGKRALKIALAQKNVAVQELAVEAFRFEIAAKVRRAFYELLAAQKITSLRKGAGGVGADICRILEKTRGEWDTPRTLRRSRARLS